MKKAIVLLLLFGLFCSKGLFGEYGFATHDGDHHISRSFDAVQALKEGHFPLRWAGSLNGWCGVPVFNFFYPLIYYLVFIVNFAVKEVINSLKIVASLSFIVGPIFFFLWLYQETKNKIASFVGAFLYLFVPYRFLLVYVRFSPEFVAYIILPILLWLFSVLISRLSSKGLDSETYIVAFVTAIAGGVFVTSHNFAVMLLLPIVGAYIFIKIIRERIFAKNKLLLIIFVFISFIGISSFFLGPMLLEMKEVKLFTMRTMDYRDHFPTLQQLIRSKWDYGNSLSGTEKDGMSFMLGYAQWLVLGFSAVCVFNLLLRKKIRKISFSVIFWLVLSCLSIFLILPWSKFIWDKIKLLQDIQFSWRFLGVTSFTIAALAGFLLSEIKDKKLFYFLTLFFLSIAFYGNRNHLRIQPTPYPQKYIDYEKNHDHRYATTSIFDDVLNKESKMLCIPSANMSSDMSISFTPPIKNVVLKTERRNTFGKVSFNAPSEFNSTLRLSLEYFPGIYKMTLNNQLVGETNCMGRVCLENVKLIKGENTLNWKIVQSPIENFFNLITVLFGTIWVVILIFVFRKKYVINKKN